MEEKILTDHKGQRLSIKWDGTRFSLVEEWDARHGYGGLWPIVLNPREAQEISEFINAHNGRYRAELRDRRIQQAVRGNGNQSASRYKSGNY